MMTALFGTNNQREARAPRRWRWSMKFNRKYTIKMIVHRLPVASSVVRGLSRLITGLAIIKANTALTAL